MSLTSTFHRSSIQEERETNEEVDMFLVKTGPHVRVDTPPSRLLAESGVNHLLKKTQLDEMYHIRHNYNTKRNPCAGYWALLNPAGCYRWEYLSSPSYLLVVFVFGSTPPPNISVSNRALMRGLITPRRCLQRQ